MGENFRESIKFWDKLRSICQNLEPNSEKTFAKWKNLKVTQPNLELEKKNYSTGSMNLDIREW